MNANHFLEHAIFFVSDRGITRGQLEAALRDCLDLERLRELTGARVVVKPTARPDDMGTLFGIPIQLDEALGRGLPKGEPPVRFGPPGPLELFLRWRH